MIHKDIVLSLYRNTLRKALDVDVECVHRVRMLFRKRRGVSNALLLQGFMREATIDPLPLSSPKVVEVEMVKSPSPSPSPTPPTPPSLHPLLTPEESAEFYSTTTAFTPEPLTHPRVDQIWLCSTQTPKWTPKSKLNPHYATSLLPTLVQHAKSSRLLAKLKNKLLNNTTTHKLRRINGTSTWLYVVNTPWNTSLRTKSANLKEIFTLRRQYDQLLCEEQLLQAHRSRYGDHAREYFQDYEQHLRNELNRVHTASIVFAQKQGILYKKTLPLFARDTARCRDRLADFISASEQCGGNGGGGGGSHLDVLGGGLSNTAKHYGFHI